MNLEKFELRYDLLLDDSPQRGEFGKQYKDSETTELYLSCQCGSEILKVESFKDEEEVYLSVFKYAPTNSSLLERLSLAWDVLKGHKINTSDIILSGENFNRLRNFGALFLLLLPLISVAQTETKVFEINEFGMQKLQPSQIIVEEKEQTKIYQVNDFGKEINPTQIIEKTETEVKVYNTNQFGIKEIVPSLIIKREEDARKDK